MASFPFFQLIKTRSTECIEWDLKKIEVNKIPNDRLEAVIRAMIKDLEKRKNNTPMTSGSRLKVFNGFC
jgi:hypothetical protein